MARDLNDILKNFTEGLKLDGITEEQLWKCIPIPTDVTENFVKMMDESLRGQITDLPTRRLISLLLIAATCQDRQQVLALHAITLPGALATVGLLFAGVSLPVAVIPIVATVGAAAVHNVCRNNPEVGRELGRRIMSGLNYINPMRWFSKENDAPINLTPTDEAVVI